MGAGVIGAQVDGVTGAPPGGVTPELVVGGINGGFVGETKGTAMGGFVGGGADLFTVLWGGFVGAMTGEGVGGGVSGRSIRVSGGIGA